MDALSKDARGFVDGLVSYLEDEKKGKEAGRVREFLSRVTVEAQKEKVAHVQTCVALTPEEKRKVERILVTLLGASKEVEYTTNKALIAGISIRVADWTLDTSFQGQLEQIQEALVS